MGDTLAEMVQEVVDQRNTLEFLCGEMVATLNLPENKDKFPPELLEIAKRWEKRFDEYTNA